MDELLGQAERFESINSKLGKAIAQAKAHLKQIERTLDSEENTKGTCSEVVVSRTLTLSANKYLN